MSIAKHKYILKPIKYLRIAELTRKYAMDSNFYENGEIEILVDTINSKEKTKLFNFINSLMWIEYTLNKIVKTNNNDIDYVPEIKQTHFEIVENFNGSNNIIFSFDRNPLYDPSNAKLVLNSELLSNPIDGINRISFGSFYEEDLNLFILNLYGRN